jgi:hypothetical protein
MALLEHRWALLKRRDGLEGSGSLSDLRDSGRGSSRWGADLLWTPVRREAGSDVAREGNGLLESDDVGGAGLDNLVVCAISRKVRLARGR